MAEEKAQSKLKVKTKLLQEISEEKLDDLLKQQRKLTLIQYIVALVVFVFGIIAYFCFGNFNINIGSISLETATINDISLNIGAILILSSLYMGIKITLNLDIEIK